MAHFYTQNRSFLGKKQLLPMVLADFFQNMLTKTQFSHVKEMFEEIFDGSNEKNKNGCGGFHAKIWLEVTLTQRCYSGY